MSESTAEAAAQPANEATEGTDTKANEAAPAQETDWKAEARKWEERSKANKTALDDLTAKHQATESKLGEMQSQIDGYEAEKAHAKLVSEVAESKGVPVGVLRGSTKEELEAHADSLKSLIDPHGPVIPGQEKNPGNVSESAERRAVRGLFGGD